MKDSARIPVVIGVTGHRDIKTEELPAVKAAVAAALQEIRGRCPQSPLLMLTPLAEGADHLCAEAALELGIPFTAVLPIPLEEYEKDFSGAALEKLRALCEKASDLFVCPETEPHRDGADHLYRQAGIYVSGHCHLLLALWDGKRAIRDGCGTADTVEFRLRRSYADRPENSLQPGYGAVLHIVTPRECSGFLHAGDTNRLGDWERFEEILAKTEQFNAETNGQWKDCYESADALSVQNGQSYRRILGGLSAAATAITVAFLLYDEATLYWMILVCGLMLLALYGINRAAKRLDCHRKYLEYRLLAEGIRVQRFLRKAGSSVEASELLPWPWQLNLPWIKSALAVLNIGPVPRDKESIEREWITDQENYHRDTLRKMKGKAKRSSHTVRICLCIAIAAYLAALIFEIFWGGLFGTAPKLPFEQLEVFRTWLKILLGSLSAATLFIGNYYGKLSLDEGIEDHERMFAMYRMTRQYIERSGEAEELLIKLAREELSENSNWYAYQSMNAPDISL